ncbi:MAG: alpha/beta fold hydrolase [Pseudomonadota bacterium]
MRLLFSRVTLLILLLLLGACEPQQSDLALQRRALQLRTRELLNEFSACPRTSTSTMPALRADSRCLVFKVPENPQESGGRQLSLQVMVVPAVRALPEPDPFVILVGGPGQAATIDGLSVLPVFQRIRQDRDILLIDQRGTGPLSPLDCKPPEDDALMNAGAELLLQIQAEFLQNCLATLDADPRYYTTDLAVDDLEAIRAYLGYGQLNLWGVSYGTRTHCRDRRRGAARYSAAGGRKRW